MVMKKNTKRALSKFWGDNPLIERPEHRVYDEADGWWEGNEGRWLNQ